MTPCWLVGAGWGERMIARVHLWVLLERIFQRALVQPDDGELLRAQRLCRDVCEAARDGRTVQVIRKLERTA